MISSPRTSSSRHARAFTLVELLLAVFLLTIGLIGLLSVFPIGADWTRQITEESIGQSVSRNAMSVIKERFTAADMAAINASANPTYLQSLPNLATKVPLNERAYQYGSPNPFPAQNPRGAAYFWTAVARLSPDQSTTGTHYDVFVLVMKKGDPGELYNTATGSMTIITNSRAGSPDEDFVPAAVLDSYYRAAKNTTSSEYVDSTRRNSPQIGDWGIGQRSGTVFRVYADGTRVLTRPRIIGTFAAGGVGSSADTNVEPVIWVPPANPMERPVADTTPSPLIYVYQTTIAF